MWLTTVVTPIVTAHSINPNLKFPGRAMKLATKLHLFMLGLALSLTSVIVSAQTTTVIKFSHVSPADSPKGKAALRFKELVERNSQRRIRVDVYPNNLLYKESDELEALQLGAVQMLAPSLAKLAQFGLQDFEVFDLPFAFTDKESVARVTEGPIGKTLLRKLESKGMVGLAYWDNGFKIMSGNKRLRVPSDFAGLAMRIHSSKVLSWQMEALGAIPLILDAYEVYPALQGGVVDGAETSPVNFYARKWYEVQSNVTISNHGYLGSAVVVNKKFWDGLPSDLRNTIDLAMREATSYGNNLAEEENAAALQWIKKSKKVKVYTLTAEETEAWRQALLPVHKELEARIGKALVYGVTRDADMRRGGAR